MLFASEMISLYGNSMTLFALLTFWQGFGNSFVKETGNDTNGKVPVCK